MLHLATFRGRHNRTKSKTLITLYHRRYKLGNRTGLGLSELAQLSGCGYNSLRAKLGRWTAWGYIERNYSTGYQGRPIFVYKLADRGKRFIEERLPPEKLAEYVIEIKQSRAKNES